MGRIPEETIEAIRDRVELVDLVGRYVSLKQAGRDHKGLCPFHQEKTPSFHVVPHKQIFYCFGCGAGGSAIDFLMRQENLTFPEAVRSLAEQLGIPIPETGSGEAGLAERIHAANHRAQQFYRDALASKEGSGARAYLEKRGIDGDAAARFGVGFAPDRWEALAVALRQDHIAAELAARAGLLAERKSGGYYDRLRGRITFPIQDARGRVVGFGGRALGQDQEPKYLNTPESPVFRKREALYGLPDALDGIRHRGRVVVVEGYFDRIALARAGVPEALATCGTSLTSGHATLLRRRAREVVLLFDADAAGERAIQRALEILLPHGLRVRAAILPAGEDPDSFLQAGGAEALAARVEEAQPALSYLIRRAAAAGASGAWERADAVAEVVPLLARLDSAVERAHFEHELARTSGAKLEAVEAAVRAAARGEGAPAEELAPVTLARPRPETRHLQDLAALLLDHPQHLAQLGADELVGLAPEGIWASLFRRFFDTFESTGGLDVDRVCDGLEEDVRSEVLALCARERSSLNSDQAARALDEILTSLRRRRLAEEGRGLTRRFQDPDADAKALLRAKQQQLEERRRLATLARAAPTTR